MSRCLEEKTLLLLSDGDGSAEERSHLRSCRSCTARYDELTRDLRSITHTLQDEPPPLRSANPRAAILYKSVSIAAGLLLVVGLLWGESRLWRTNRSPLSEQALNSEISQFLEQVSEAIFDSRNIREAETALSESSLASVQIALGENCLDDCRQFFSSSFFADANSTDQPFVAVKRRSIDPAMQQWVSNPGE